MHIQTHTQLAAAGGDTVNALMSLWDTKGAQAVDPSSDPQTGTVTDNR